MSEAKELARRLVARYHAEGLGGMTGAEVSLLLSEKQLHLAEVSERLGRCEDVMVGIRLKAGLENEVRVIGEHQTLQQRSEDFEKQLESVRPVTRNLIESVMLDVWPA